MSVSTAIAGYSGKVYVSDDDTEFTEVAQLQDVELNITADMLDASNHSTAAGGWKRKKPGMLDWTATAGSLVANSDDANQLIYDALVGRTQVTFRFDPEGSDTAKPRYSGVGYIKGWKETSPTSDLAKISVEFEGDGPLARAAITAP